MVRQSGLERFSRLHRELSIEKDVLARQQILRQYLRHTCEDEQIAFIDWVIGLTQKRVINKARLEQQARHEAGLPDWLFDESLKVVGDLSETISLILGATDDLTDQGHSLCWLLGIRLPELRQLPEEDLGAAIRADWQVLNQTECRTYNRFLMGACRSNVSEFELCVVLSETWNVTCSLLQFRMRTTWKAKETEISRLKVPATESEQGYLPKGFAHPSSQIQSSDSSRLVSFAEPSAERVQWIQRGNKSFIWDESHRLLAEVPQEISKVIESRFGDVVLDGWLCSENHCLEFSVLDILQFNGASQLDLPWESRRDMVAEKLNDTNLPLKVVAAMPVQRGEEYVRRLVALASSPTWFGFIDQSDPQWCRIPCPKHRFHAVLMYVQRANRGDIELLTCGVWHNGQVISVAKVPLELALEDRTHLEQFVKLHSLERFGPVRTVELSQVIEIECGAVKKSSRHKSGLVLESPRMTSWNRTHAPEDAATLEWLVERVL